MIAEIDGSCYQSPEEGRWVRVRGPHQAQEGQAWAEGCGLRREAWIHQGGTRTWLGMILSVMKIILWSWACKSWTHRIVINLPMFGCLRFLLKGYYHLADNMNRKGKLSTMILTLTVFRVSSVTSSMTLAVALLLLSSTSVILTDTRSRRSSLLLLRVSNSV